MTLPKEAWFGFGSRKTQLGPSRDARNAIPSFINNLKNPLNMISIEDGERRDWLGLAKVIREDGTEETLRFEHLEPGFLIAHKATGCLKITQNGTTETVVIQGGKVIFREISAKNGLPMESSQAPLFSTDGMRAT